MLTLAVQAGGLSRRMGQDKGLVPLHGKPLIEHVLDRLEGLADETLITSNNPENYQYLKHPIASDKIPGAGALSGLETALEAATGEHVFVIACDMPLVNKELVEFIVSYSDKADLVIPVFNDRYQPLLALYQREECLKAIKYSLANNQRRMIGFHQQVTVHEIPPKQIEEYDAEGHSFVNVNSPEDLAQLEKKQRFLLA